MIGLRLWSWGQLMLGLLYPARCPLCDGFLTPRETVWANVSGQLRYRGAARDKRKAVSGKCEFPWAGIHQECRDRLAVIREPVCLRCGRPLASERGEYCGDCARLSAGKNRGLTMEKGFVQGRSLFLYRGPVRAMLYRFKYANRREYGSFFAYAALRLWREWLTEADPEVIVPVPMYDPKRRRRGYNQAAVFARELSRLTGIPWDGRYVRRVRDTKPMKDLDDLQRKNNLKNAFQIRNKGVKYNRILLVDDIYTTGTTAEAVTEVLRRSGTLTVYFMSISIGKGLSSCSDLNRDGL